MPMNERPPGTFSTPVYPLIPGLFTAMAVVIVLSSFWTDPGGSILGTLLLATGIPAFFFWRGRHGSTSNNG